LFTRVSLPLVGFIVVFMVVVAGLAWLNQNLRTTRLPQPGRVPAPNDVFLQFDEKRAVWDKDDPEHGKEFELGMEGHYDFPFINPTDAPVQLGLVSVSCGCSNVGVCTLSAEQLEAFKKDRKDEHLLWQVLPKGYQGVNIPPHTGGIVRLGWTPRQSNQRKRLAIGLWTESGGKRTEDLLLECTIQMVTPVRCSPRIADIGTLTAHGTAQHDFWCWSATRAHFDLAAQDKEANPCFIYKITPLSPAEFPKLQKMLQEEHGIDTRVQAAYKLTVEVYEERGGKQFDLGPFERTVPLIVDGNQSDEPLGPVIKGMVRGIIDLPADQQGQVNLKLFTVDGVPEWHFIVRTPPDVKLVVEQVPSFLSAMLTSKSASRGEWDLHLKLKPGVLQPGPIENSTILLRTDGTPTRRIRIPVVGTATKAIAARR
jgi:hypothetical protein